MYLTLLPAYGRDYKSKKAFIEDIKSNKDFIVAESRQYINCLLYTSPSPRD